MGEVTPTRKSRMADLEDRIQRHHGNWVAPLVGRTCNRIVIDKYAPPLAIWFLYDGPDAHVQIDSSFRFQDGTETLKLDPENERDALAPVLSLIGRTVTHSIAGEDGSLRIEFDGGAVIEVDCLDVGSESWFFHVDDETEVWTPQP